MRLLNPEDVTSDAVRSVAFDTASPPGLRAARDQKDSGNLRGKGTLPFSPGCSG